MLLSCFPAPRVHIIPAVRLPSPGGQDRGCYGSSLSQYCVAMETGYPRDMVSLRYFTYKAETGESSYHSLNNISHCVLQVLL